MAKDTEKKFTMADFAKKINKEYNNNNLVIILFYVGKGVNKNFSPLRICYHVL